MYSVLLAFFFFSGNLLEFHISRKKITEIPVSEHYYQSKYSKCMTN